MVGNRCNNRLILVADVGVAVERCHDDRHIFYYGFAIRLTTEETLILYSTA
jgi:hypothetical protein